MSLIVLYIYASKFQLGAPICPGLPVPPPASRTSARTSRGHRRDPDFAVLSSNRMKK